MKLEIVEQDKDKIKIAFVGETQTLPQLLATEIWNNNGEAAAIQEHPFLESPKLIVRGKYKTLLKKSAEIIEKQCDEFKDKFLKATK